MKFRVCPRCSNEYLFPKNKCVCSYSQYDWDGSHVFWMGDIYVNIDPIGKCTRIVKNGVGFDLPVMLPVTLTKEQLDKYLLLI